MLSIQMVLSKATALDPLKWCKKLDYIPHLEKVSIIENAAACRKDMTEECFDNYDRYETLCAYAILKKERDRSFTVTKDGGIE